MSFPASDAVRPSRKQAGNSCHSRRRGVRYDSPLFISIGRLIGVFSPSDATQLVLSTVFITFLHSLPCHSFFIFILSFSSKIGLIFTFSSVYECIFSSSISLLILIIYLPFCCFLKLLFFQSHGHPLYFNSFYSCLLL